MNIEVDLKEHLKKRPDEEESESIYYENYS